MSVTKVANTLDQNLLLILDRHDFPAFEVDPFRQDERRLATGNRRRADKLERIGFCGGDRRLRVEVLGRSAHCEHVVRAEREMASVRIGVDGSVVLNRSGTPCRYGRTSRRQGRNASKSSPGHPK